MSTTFHRHHSLKNQIAKELMARFSFLTIRDLQLGMELSDEQTQAIMEFVKSLTGDAPAHFSAAAD
jgi:hypothetical protein